MKLADQRIHYQRDAEQFDYFAPRSGADLDAARRLQQAVLHHLPSMPKRRILDVGSGSGWLGEELERRSAQASMVVSIDLGIANLRKIRSRSPGALLVAADVDRLPFRAGSFDSVVASEVLEHLNRPDHAVRQLADVLAPAGRLVVTTPYREMLRYHLCIHCNQPTPVNAHLHSFDEHALRRMFSDAALGNIRHRTFQNKALVFLRISVMLRFLPFGLWGVIDRLCNLVIGKPHSIVITGDNPDTHAP
jgi:2-polyprenyl-3-methyl-5-hydroxy-6-metoxy-1,4-benzoquinol methylase